MPLANGEVFAGYRIVRRLGSGGMGEVYLADHPNLPLKVALKILRAAISADPGFRQHFYDEAHLAAALVDHSLIVRVLDRGEDGGQLWISMEFIDGTDAERQLRDTYPAGLARPRVVEIVSAVADALDYAHDNGLLHRDVKPGNILLRKPDARGRRILLADFGIARRLDSSLTYPAAFVGTMNYAAPEQRNGEVLDGRADQYALAVTAYQLLTGSLPFDHPNFDVYRPVAGIRPGLADLDPILRKALSKSPSDRFRNCTEFARGLTSPRRAKTVTPPPQQTTDEKLERGIREDELNVVHEFLRAQMSKNRPPPKPRSTDGL
jgi:serine/threonine-protein kinase